MHGFSWYGFASGSILDLTSWRCQESFKHIDRGVLRFDNGVYRFHIAHGAWEFRLRVDEINQQSLFKRLSCWLIPLPIRKRRQLRYPCLSQFSSDLRLVPAEW